MKYNCNVYYTAFLVCLAAITLRDKVGIRLDAAGF